MSIAHDIADVQGGTDTRRIAIDRVGIRGLRHPISVSDRDGAVQPATAIFSMYVHLAEQHRGAHMSRFIELLNAWDEPLSVATLPRMLDLIAATLHSDQAYVEARFGFFVRKLAPVSKVASLLDYEVILSAELKNGEHRVTVKAVVPVTSLCPCSKEISAYGAHNQRSHITVTATAVQNVWIRDVIDIVEAEASCEIFGLLKRPDEKYVTERAYDNPKFVEDVVRDIAARLNADARVLAYSVEAENFESIHNHSAYAAIEAVISK